MPAEMSFSLFRPEVIRAGTEGDERQQDEVLHDNDDDADDRLGRLVRPHREHGASVVYDGRGWDHVRGVIDRPDTPHAHHHHVGSSASEPLTEDERVDDGHVSFDGH